MHLLYDLSCMRINVSYVLSICTRYQLDLGKEYWKAIKNILKYLRKTKYTLLIYEGETELIVRG